MTVTVVNKYKEPNHIYCGRGSPVGNPFSMVGGTSRDEVCDMYEAWFERKMSGKENEVISFTLYLVEMAKQKDINLGCFCAPKRCHCDTIKAYIDKVNVDSPPLIWDETGDAIDASIMSKE